MSIDYHLFCQKDTSINERRLFNIGDIWSNSAACLICGDIIRSVSLNDFKWCSCENVAVDGGSWYLKRVVKNNKKYRDLSIMFDDSPVEDQNKVSFAKKVLTFLFD